MSDSKARFLSLAFLTLLLFDTCTNASTATPPLYTSRFTSATQAIPTGIHSPSLQPQNHDTKHVEEATNLNQQNQHRELAVRKTQTEPSQQPSDQKMILVLQSYTKLSGNTLAFIQQDSAKNGVPLSISLGLMQQESSFRADAKNPITGAVGLGQLETPTAVELASRAGVATGSLEDPICNARLTISYLRYLYQQTGDWNAALTAYNRGLHGLTLYQQNHGTSVSDYSSGVLHKAQHIETMLTTI